MECHPILRRKALWRLCLLLTAVPLCAALVPTKTNVFGRPTTLHAVGVALTRELGKNVKLTAALKEFQAQGKIKIHELPCIAHADGPDYDQLKDILRKERWDYVAITSPEAARVLASAWPYGSTTTAATPSIAAVGKATELALNEASIPVAFCPSKATAEVLVQELPAVNASHERPKVLYPASAKAQETLQIGLEARGFAVTRLNTYDTVTAVWNEQEKAAAETCQIVCLASPSALKGWLKNSNDNRSVLAACIGETSANACRKHGWTDDSIFYPETNPGMEGWVQAVESAIHACEKLPMTPSTSPL